MHAAVAAAYSATLSKIFLPCCGQKCARLSFGYFLMAGTFVSVSDYYVIVAQHSSEGVVSCDMFTPMYT
jgi:hypothetical protein